jgi:cell division septation protein DedD
MRRRWALALALLLPVAVLPFSGASGAPVPEAPNCAMFPANSFWHADVSKLPLDAKSATYVSSIGASTAVHPDFGTVWNGAPNGIPYTAVPGTQTKVPVSFDYADESDPGPYPIPPNAPIEGGSQSTGDRHVLLVDKDVCKLYEMFDAHPQSDGSWHAGSGAVFDMKSNSLRPAGWTSADAAGLAILPGLVRYDEVASGRIDHALRITVNATDARYIWPARHQAGSASSTRPPMGERLRLKASVDISTFSPANQVILQALKTYGAIVADNGSSWYVSGAPDSRWNDSDLHNLTLLHGSDFEAVDESSLMVDPNSGAVKTSASTTTTSTTRPPTTTTTVKPTTTTTTRPQTTTTTTTPKCRRLCKPIKWR